MRQLLTIAAMSMLLAGCQEFPTMGRPALPETSRTAKVHDVTIGMTEITPPEVTVGVGDEVRFINDQTHPVRVILIEAGKNMACRRGFTGTIDQEAEIEPAGSASMCFESGGIVKYMVRPKSQVPAGGKVLTARINIQEHAAAPMPGAEMMPAQR